MPSVTFDNFRYNLSLELHWVQLHNVTSSQRDYPIALEWEKQALAGLLLLWVSRVSDFFFFSRGCFYAVVEASSISLFSKAKSSGEDEEEG